MKTTYTEEELKRKRTALLLRRLKLEFALLNLMFDWQEYNRHVKETLPWHPVKLDENGIDESKEKIH